MELYFLRSHLIVGEVVQSCDLLKVKFAGWFGKMILNKIKRKIIFIVHILLCGLLTGCHGPAFSQTALVTGDTINYKVQEREDEDSEGILFKNPWKYFIGDDSLFAEEKYNDSAWKELKAGAELSLIDHQELSKKNGITWFRTRIEVDSTATGKALAFHLKQYGTAAAIYLDGKLLEEYGKVGYDIKSEKPAGFNAEPFPVVFSTAGTHLLAIRYSSFHRNSSHVEDGESGFEIEFSDLHEEFHDLIDKSSFFPVIFLFAVFITLGMVHSIIFFFFRSDRQNLFFGLYCIGIAFILFAVYYFLTVTDYEVYELLQKALLYVAPFVVVPLVAFYHTIFYNRLLKIFWIMIMLYLFAVVSNFLDWGIAKAMPGILIFLGVVEIIRVIIRAVVKGKDGALILGLGIFYLPLSIIVMLIVAIVLSQGNHGENVNLNLGKRGAEILAYSLALSIPFSITLYLARNFARINRKLIIQVDEIKALSERTLKQELEKKKILEEQNLLLETRVAERTRELAEKNEVILLKNREITENLTYAKRIQSALLPDTGLLKSHFIESFVLFMPKDIVSGDFYAFIPKQELFFVAVADCTGHGVSGAFMSLIGTSILNQLVSSKSSRGPSEILDLLNEEVIVSLNQRSGDSNDGMDIALCAFNMGAMQLEYAGANRPLWVIRDGLCLEFLPDKIPIGGLQVVRLGRYTNHVINIKKGDSLYLFSDGFADQFGGSLNKKLMTRKLKETLTGIQQLSMPDQQEFLLRFIEEWKGENEQLDDILMVGIRI